VSVREIFFRRLTWTGIVAFGGVSAAFVYLSLPGYVAAALLVLFAGLIGPVIFTRIQRWRLPARTERLQEAALLPWPCKTVWDLVKPAENSPLLDPTIRRGYRVPGTPDGLGEQQAFEREDGWTIIIEVTEYQHGRRAVTSQVSPPAAEQLRTVQTVEPVDGGCKYRIAVEIELRAGQRVLPQFEKEWRDGTRVQLERTEQTLAAELDRSDDE